LDAVLKWYWRLHQGVMKKFFPAGNTVRRWRVLKGATAHDRSDPHRSPVADQAQFEATAADLSDRNELYRLPAAESSLAAGLRLTR
jgi:hypothetical protein